MSAAPFLETNVAGTLALLEAARAADEPRGVHRARLRRGIGRGDALVAQPHAERARLRAA